MQGKPLGIFIPFGQYVCDVYRSPVDDQRRLAARSNRGAQSPGTAANLPLGAVLGRGKVDTRFAESQPVRADGLEAARSLAWRCNFPWSSRWDRFLSDPKSGEISGGISRNFDCSSSTW